MVEKDRTLLALLDILKILVMHLLTNFHPRCASANRFANTARKMDGVTLNHLEIGSTNQRVRAEHDIKVWIAGDRQPFVGLVAMVVPEVTEIQPIAADQFERRYVALLECLVACCQNQGINAPRG